MRARLRMHLEPGIQADDLLDAGLVVVREVQPGADADLEHPALRQWNDLLPLPLNRADAAGDVDQPRQHVPFVPVAAHRSVELRAAQRRA